MDDLGKEAVHSPRTETHAASSTVQDDVSAISKNQLKRQAKYARLEGVYKQRKAAKKEKHRTQQAEKRAKKLAEFEALSPEAQQRRRDESRAVIAARAAARKDALAKLDAAERDGPRLIVDLDFWELMHTQERRSMMSQLAHCAGVNKRAAAPCALHFTSSCSFKGPLAELLKQMQPGCGNWRVTYHEAGLPEAFAHDKASLVYLTADAEEEVTGLQPGCGYVIGGLVDRNRHKRLCLDKAAALGIKAARLPIGDHMKLAGSKVLTVNQIVDLLLKYHETSDWKQACEHVVPARKVQTQHADPSSTEGAQSTQGEHQNSADGSVESAGADV